LAVYAAVAAAVGFLVITARANADDKAPPPPLRLVNYGGYYSAASVEKDLRKSLDEQFLGTLDRERKAVFLLQDNLLVENGRNYCVAFMGITDVPPKGRLPRVPAALYSGLGRSNLQGKLTDDQLNGCMATALDTAIANFVAEAPESRLRDLERTNEKGTRKGEPARDDAFVFTQGLSHDGTTSVLSSIPQEFEHAFDYRRLAWVVLATAAIFDNQQVVCYTVAGVAGRPPDNRNPRLPAFKYYRSAEFSLELSRAPDATKRCKDAAAKYVVDYALSQSWDDKALLKDFSYAQEAGVTSVSNYRKADPAAKLAKFRQSLHVGSDSHCGLVIEVKGPVAKVQSMIGEVWLKTAQLYPKGEEGCRFVNGVYQDP
jgi:hypothetical protein